VPSDRLRGYGLALVAAALWATLGLFYKSLAALVRALTTSSPLFWLLIPGLVPTLGAVGCR